MLRPLNSKTLSLSLYIRYLFSMILLFQAFSEGFPLGFPIYRFHYNPKKDRITDTTTTRKTQLPSQAAATRAVSGSPEFHFWIE